MSRKTTLSAIGGYQPFLFCAGMYFVALFFSIFICSAIFHAANPKKSMADKKVTMGKEMTGSRQVLLTVTNK